MVSILSLSVVDRGFKTCLNQIIDYKIGIHYFLDKCAALRSKSKDWMAWYWDNVSEWRDMSIYRLLSLVQSKHHHLFECDNAKKNSSLSNNY